MTTAIRLSAPFAALAALALAAPPADATGAPARKAAASAGARKPATKSSGAGAARGFAHQVEYRDGGHLLGNPEAETRLVEYMSYTCSHCYEFHREGDPAIRMLLLPGGKTSYEIRHSLRDIVDLTATMLTHCGAPGRFMANHEALLAAQPKWMAKARGMTQAQMVRWNNGALGARLRAVASDLDFYGLMEARGFTRAELDRCLTDEAKAQSLAQTSARDNQQMNIPGTPSFAINGKLLDDVFSWDALKPFLDRKD